MDNKQGVEHYSRQAYGKSKLWLHKSAHSLKEIKPLALKLVIMINSRKSHNTIQQLADQSNISWFPFLSSLKLEFKYLMLGRTQGPARAGRVLSHWVHPHLLFLETGFHCGTLAVQELTV